MSYVEARLAAALVVFLAGYTGYPAFFLSYHLERHSVDVVNTSFDELWQLITNSTLSDATRRTLCCVADSPKDFVVSRLYVSAHVLGFETKKTIPFHSQAALRHPDARLARAISTRKTGLFEWACYYGNHRVSNQFYPGLTTDLNFIL